MFDLAVTQPKKMLHNLAAWMEKAEGFAEQKGFDPDRWLTVRLVPDMLGFVRQVSAACDAAKFLGARLAGVTPPKHEDNEATWAEVKERVAKTIAFLDTLEASQFEGAESRRIELPFLPEGKWVSGSDYAHEMGLPNFYFHVVTSYALLRQGGVDVGKRDFIGGMNLQG